MDTKKIEELIAELSEDSFNPELNLAIAIEYEKLGQTASAVAFYLRAAEYGYGEDVDVVYSALLKISICMNGQMGRDLTVSNSLLQAIAYVPYRPEAYYLMSMMYEQSGQWQECYTYAKLAGTYDRQLFDLSVDIGYHPWYSYNFQTAVAAWWIGRREESLTIFNKLVEDDRCPEHYKALAIQNLKSLQWV